jgi:hypothetical protein
MNGQMGDWEAACGGWCATIEGPEGQIVPVGPFEEPEAASDWLEEFAAIVPPLTENSQIAMLHDPVWVLQKALQARDSRGGE